jgi:hypothetical protein
VRIAEPAGYVEVTIDDRLRRFEGALRDLVLFAVHTAVRGHDGHVLMLLP